AAAAAHTGTWSRTPANLWGPRLHSSNKPPQLQVCRKRCWERGMIALFLRPGTDHPTDHSDFWCPRHGKARPAQRAYLKSWGKTAVGSQRVGSVAGHVAIGWQ